MDILKLFVLDGTDHAVNVRWEDDRPLFRANEIGDILGLTRVRKTILEFDADEKVATTSGTLGGEQTMLFLTEAGLYRLLMISRKPIARPFQKWVTHVIISIREKGKYELQQYIEEIEKQKDKLMLANSNYEALKKEAEHFKVIAQKSIHQSYIEAYANKYIVYFGKIRRIEAHGEMKWLVKIGSTKNIKTRASDLEDEFGSMQIIKCIDCPCNEQLEIFLHNHKDIRVNAFTEVVHESRASHEVFTFNEKELEKAINIALHNVYKFRSMWNLSNEIEVQKVKLEQIKEIKDILQLTTAKNVQVAVEDTLPTLDAVSVLTSPQIDPIILHADARRYTQALGKKVQRYSADGKTLLQTYASAIEALRDPQLDSPSRTRINAAVKSNTVYKNYRWALLDRNLSDDTMQDLEPTAEKTADIRKGYVAMLNIDQTRIEEVFSNQKEAGKNRKFKSSAPVCTSIKYGTQSGGHYFRMWYDCLDSLKSEFLTRKSLPDASVSNGKQIEKLHPVTEEVLQVYPSVAHLVKDYQFSRASLYNVINNKFIAKGFKWRFGTESQN